MLKTEGYRKRWPSFLAESLHNLFRCELKTRCFSPHESPILKACVGVVPVFRKYTGISR